MNVSFLTVIDGCLVVKPVKVVWIGNLIRVGGLGKFGALERYLDRMRRALSLVGTVLLLILMAAPGAQAVPGFSPLSPQFEVVDESVTPTEETQPSQAPTSDPAPSESGSTPEPTTPQDPQPTEPPVEEQSPPPADPPPPAVPVDPVTGFQIDPGTGFLIYPGNGWLIEPGTGRLLVYGADGTLVGSGFVWDAATGLVSEETPEEPTETPSPEPTPTETPTPSATPSVTPSATPSATASQPAAEQTSDSEPIGATLWFRISVVLILVALGALYFLRLHRGRRNGRQSDV